MKKRLHDKKTKNKEIFILIFSIITVTFSFSFDIYFCDIVCMTPGVILSLIYLYHKKIYLSYILSGYYSLLWILGFNEKKYLSFLLFIFFVLISNISKKRNSVTKYLYPSFYFIQYVFCTGVFNMFTLWSSQLIQPLFFLILFLHIKDRSFF